MNREIANAIFFIRTFSSVGFGFIYSSLILYLIKNIGFSETDALSFTGIFIALHYSLSTISGLILGKWVSNINSLIIGIVIQIISLPIIYNLLGFHILIWGCTLFLLGSLLSSPTINMMITERYDSQDSSRERAFMWNYAGMNLGNLIGFSVAGYFQILNNLASVVYIVILLMLSSLTIALFYKRKIKDIYTPYAKYDLRTKIRKFIHLIILLIILAEITKDILLFSNKLSVALMILILLSFVGLLALNFKRSSNKRDACMFIILAFSYLLFWSLYFLIPTGLTLFASYNTTGKILNIAIPPAWLSNINSFFIILGAPLLAVILKRFDSKFGWLAINKFILGLFFLAAAFILVNIGILLSHFELVSLIWLALCYVLLTLSELFIAPVGFATVGHYIDRRLQPLMTGLWVSILGLGGLIASKLSTFIEFSNQNIVQSNTHFLKLFSCLAILSLVCCFTLIYFNVLTKGFIRVGRDNK